MNKDILDETSGSSGIVESALSIPIGSKVADYLKRLPILTVVDHDELCEDIKALSIPDRNAVGAALQYYSANTGVSMRGKGRSRPKFYYALRLDLTYDEHKSDEVYLSLPGIPRELLKRETREEEVEKIISHLQDKHGKDAIDYWGKAAQYRSVDICRASMRQAIQRDKHCRLCVAADRLCQQNSVHSTWNAPRKISASHIAARKTIFWQTLNEVDEEGIDIFSDAGTGALVARLQANKYHSDSRYIAGLCSEHDSQIQRLLAEAAI